MIAGFACMRRAGAVAAACGLIALSGGARAAEATGPFGLIGSEPSYVDLGAGAFDAFDGDHSQRHQTAELRGEFRYGQKLWYIGPAAGVMANAKGGRMIYGGVYADAKFGPFVFTLMGGAGAYFKGGSADLGGRFEFRPTLEGTYEFHNGTRLGAQFAHISNWGTHAINPSENELLLTYAVPLPF